MEHSISIDPFIPPSMDIQLAQARSGSYPSRGLVDCSGRGACCSHGHGVPALLPSHSPPKANGPWCAPTIPWPRSAVVPGTLVRLLRLIRLVLLGNSPTAEDEIPIRRSHSSEAPNFQYEMGFWQACRPANSRGGRTKRQAGTGLARVSPIHPSILAHGQPSQRLVIGGLPVSAIQYGVRSTP